MEEIDGYNVKLDKAYTKMMSGNYDYASASKEDKLDVTGLIINPSFQKRTYDATTAEWKDASSADGWTTTGGTATGGLNYEIFKLEIVFTGSGSRNVFLHFMQRRQQRNRRREWQRN